MDQSTSETNIVPDRVSVRTLGILNVVFAIGLIAGGTCVNLYALALPLVGGFLEKQLQREEANAAQLKAKMTRLADEEQAARPEDKPRIAKEREALSSLAGSKPGADAAVLRLLSDRRIRDPKIIGHFLFDLSSGLLLNLLMLIAGVGLLYYQGWGRILAIGVAGLKILRLLALAGSATFLLGPYLGTTIAQIEAEALAGSPEEAAHAPRDGESVTWMVRSSTAGVALVGMVYPVVTILILSRPSAKAAPRRVR